MSFQLCLCDGPLLFAEPTLCPLVGSKRQSRSGERGAGIGSPAQVFLEGPGPGPGGAGAPAFAARPDPPAPRRALTCWCGEGPHPLSQCPCIAVGFVCWLSTTPNPHPTFSFSSPHSRLESAMLSPAKQVGRKGRDMPRAPPGPLAWQGARASVQAAEYPPSRDPGWRGWALHPRGDSHLWSRGALPACLWLPSPQSRLSLQRMGAPTPAFWTL